jgi:GntR family transcriptional regulator
VAIVRIDQRDATPIYAQLERGLRAAIAAGQLRPGDQLPTVRQLAVDLAVNANTVARVYAELERDGVLETRRGVGSFVSATPARAHPPRERARRLRAFVTRMLADAEAAGFAADELVDGIREHGQGGSFGEEGRDRRAPLLHRGSRS